MRMALLWIMSVCLRSRNHFEISAWANRLIFEESCNLVAQEIIKTCKQGNSKNRCLQGSVLVYDCAHTRLSAQSGFK